MKKNILFFAFFVSMFTIFFPEKVKADGDIILQKCIYETGAGLVKQHNSIENSEYVIYIYDNYDIDGYFKIWKGDYVDNHDSLRNRKDLKSKVKGSDSGSAICPPYVFVQKQKHAGGAYRVDGAFSEDEANKFYKNNKGGKGWGWGDDDCGIIKLTGSYNNKGEVTGNVGGATGTSGGGSGVTWFDQEDGANQAKCDYILGDPDTEGSMAWFLQKILNYIKILGPILVVVLSTLDFTKTIMTSDAESMKKAQKKLFIRIGCAVGLFFLPLIATVLLNLINGTTGDQACGLK